MKNIKVGQLCEISGDDSVIVTATNPVQKTVDLTYTNHAKTGPYEHGDPPPDFYGRHEDEIVDMGNGRVIWNSDQ